METTRILQAVYMRDAAAKLNEYVENAMMKKKRKTSSAVKDENVRDFYVYNFLEVKQVKLNHRIVEEEALRVMKDHSRSKEIFVIQSDQIIENVNKFRILYQKLIKHPSFLTKSELLPVELVLKAKFYQKNREFLQQFITDKAIDKNIDIISNSLQNWHDNNRSEENKRMDEINMKMILYKSEMETESYYRQLRDEVNYQLPKIRSDYNFEEGSMKLRIISLFHYQRWLNELLKVTVFKNINSSSNIRLAKVWQSNFIEKETEAIVSKRITGKMLYSIEEEINKMKNSFQTAHLNRQYLIRQKKYGLPSISNNLTQIDKANTIGKSEISDFKNNVQKREEVTKPQYLINQNQPSQPISNEISIRDKFRVYEQIPNNKLYARKDASSQKVTIQDKKVVQQQPKIQKYFISKINPQSSFSQVNQQKQQRPSYNYQPLRLQNHRQYKYEHKKPSPLMPHHFRQLSYNQDDTETKPKKLPTSTSGLVQAMNNVAKKYQKSPQLKYPIKIEAFQMYTAKESTLCYHIQTINLKELPLKFIQDRLKFSQNRVKIEYPSNYDLETEKQIIKSMHIINCLGGEVTCEVESAYQMWNQIDEIDIMVVSWMLEVPVRDVVQLYGQFVKK